MKILITGGAGFVGSNLARLFVNNLRAKVTVLDNLKRRGSEINVENFKKLGIDFCHGDIRVPSDLENTGEHFDLLVDASAEPSVLAGVNGSADYVLQTNLVGTINCLEFARKRAGAFLFLSTSRVYSIEPLKAINLIEAKTRFEIDENQTLPGVTPAGIAEAFPVNSSRSFYGASKLASELIAQEYCANYKLPVMINRCGVIAGPGQFGKVDQGVFTLWVMNHVFGKPLKYTGFGGTGKQVRDLVHPLDLFSLINTQISQISDWNGDVFNVGGGREISVSMQELTALCQEATGKAVPITEDKSTSSVDIPLYVSNTKKIQNTFNWRPKISASELIRDIAKWVAENETKLKTLL